MWLSIRVDCDSREKKSISGEGLQDFGQTITAPVIDEERGIEITAALAQEIRIGIVASKLYSPLSLVVWYEHSKAVYDCSNPSPEP